MTPEQAAELVDTLQYALCALWVLIFVILIKP
jgi:hypothetical protein